MPPQQGPPPPRRGLFEAVLIGFFASHIPITLMVDGQALLPAALYTWGPRSALDWYLSWSLDPLMGSPPPWFRAIIACELLFQVPFFFVALQELLAPPRRARGEPPSGALRNACIAYGAHVATTLVPILATFLAHAAPGYSDTHRYALVGIYLPYLLVPLALLWRACAHRHVFGADENEDARKRAA